MKVLTHASRRLLAVPLFLAAGAASALAQTTATAPGLLPLWEVTDGRGTVYLLGSIHMLRADMYPLDDAIYAAFDDADIAAFEINLDSATAAAPLIAMRGMYQDGRSLRTVLPPDLFAELEEHFGNVGVPMQAVAMMKPWMAALSVSALMLQQAGYEGAQGVDMHFFERARSNGIRVASFETMEQQIDVFDGMPESEQIAYLRSTLEDLDDFVDMLDGATEMWRRGDAEAIAAMMTESMESQPNLRRRLLDDRNAAWIPRIEELLRSGDTAIVIVGMAHLVGEGSVTDLLRDRGYTVTRRTDGS